MPFNEEVSSSDENKVFINLGKGAEKAIVKLGQMSPAILCLDDDDCRVTTEDFKRVIKAIPPSVKSLKLSGRLSNRLDFTVLYELIGETTSEQATLFWPCIKNKYVTLTDEKKARLLSYAAGKGDIAYVKVFLKAGAKPWVKSDIISGWMTNAICYAIWSSIAEEEQKENESPASQSPSESPPKAE